jgi:hypothetical protein
MPSPPYKISSRSTNRFKILTYRYLRSLNVRHLGMVKAMTLKIRSQGHLQCHHLLARFHSNPPVGSKVIKEFLYTHLRSLNVRHFGVNEATRLNTWRRGHLQWYHLPTKFHENSPIGSKVISGIHTQTNRLVI